MAARLDIISTSGETGNKEQEQADGITKTDTYHNTSCINKQLQKYMNYEMFGIVATLLVLGSVMVITTAEILDFDLPVNFPIIDEKKIEQIAPAESNPYFDWCYKMKIDCS